MKDYYEPKVYLYAATVSRNDSAESYRIYMVGGSDLQNVKRAYSVYLPWLIILDIAKCEKTEAETVRSDPMKYTIIKTFFNVYFLPEEIQPTEEEYLIATENTFLLCK